MKKIIVAIIAILNTVNAYAFEEKDASNLAKKYSEIIACQLEGATYKAVKIHAGDPQMNGYGDKFVVYWQGDVGCSGGSGTIIPNLTVIEHTGFNSASPVVLPEYKMPDIDLSTMTSFTADKNGIITLSGLTYGKNDQQHQPKKRVSYKLKDDGTKLVIVK